jgi:molybdopterin molybdotransferase
MLGLDRARALILAAAGPLGAEDAALAAARGRVLAKPVRAGIDLPGFDQSAVDGYALAGAEKASATRSGAFRLPGRSEAGVPFGGTLNPGTAVRILTGAAVPRGTRAVAMQERSFVTGSRLMVEPVPAGANIRRKGEDVRKGELVLAAGVTIGPREIGLLAALGIGRVRVIRPPLLSIVATGTELRKAGTSLPPGGVYDANGPLVEALAREAGAEVAATWIVRDDMAALVKAIARGLRSDVLILCGGVSVGDRDFVRPALKKAGVREVFRRVNIKPGMPVCFGVRGPKPRPKLVFGLPGNPVSVYVTFNEFVRPALHRLGGRAWTDGFVQSVTLAAPVRTSRRRKTHFIRVARDGGDGNGRIAVRPLRHQGSHQLHALVNADGWIRVDSRSGGLPAGSRVAARMES